MGIIDNRVWVTGKVCQSQRSSARWKLGWPYSSLLAFRQASYQHIVHNPLQTRQHSILGHKIISLAVAMVISTAFSLQLHVRKPRQLRMHGDWLKDEWGISWNRTCRADVVDGVEAVAMISRAVHRNYGQAAADVLLVVEGVSLNGVCVMPDFEWSHHMMSANR